MKNHLDMHPPTEAVEHGRRSLEQNEYPGRVLIMGLSADGEAAVQAYALTGRSEGSRNRIFAPEDNGRDVMTAAPGTSQEEMAQVENAELIYYQAMDDDAGVYVVSNGAQTTHVLTKYLEHPVLESAIKRAPVVNGVSLSEFEPDTPNFTPRITGVIRDNLLNTPFALSVVRRHPNTGAPVYCDYTAPDLRKMTPGVGYGVQTYTGNGNPLPSFDRKPYAFPIGETAEETAKTIWGVLNRDNRVAVVVRDINLGVDNLEYFIINHGEEQAWSA